MVITPYFSSLRCPIADFDAESHNLWPSRASIYSVQAVALLLRRQCILQDLGAWGVHCSRRPTEMRCALRQRSKGSKIESSDKPPGKAVFVFPDSLPLVTEIRRSTSISLALADVSDPSIVSCECRGVLFTVRLIGRLAPMNQPTGLRKEDLHHWSCCSSPNRDNLGWSVSILMIYFLRWRCETNNAGGISPLFACHARQVMEGGRVAVLKWTEVNYRREL